jgi:hypothetical protein
VDHDDGWPGDHSDASGTPDDLPESPGHDPGDYDTADLSADDHGDYGSGYGSDDPSGAPDPTAGDNLDGDDLSADHGADAGDEPPGATHADGDASGEPGADGDSHDSPADDHSGEADHGDVDAVPDEHGEAGTPGDDHGDQPDQGDAGDQADQDAHEHASDDAADTDATQQEHFGAGLDSAGDHEGSWHDDEFPAQLDLHAPEPLDGYPWTDPGSLGALDDLADHGVADVTQPADPQDLFDYAGLDPEPGSNPWEQLLASDDPATSALARWWGPPA